MVKRYAASLSAEEKTLLDGILKFGTKRDRKMTYACYLLRADDGWADQEIPRELGVSIPNVQWVRFRFVEQSSEAVLCPSSASISSFQYQNPQTQSQPYFSYSSSDVIGFYFSKSVIT